MAGEICEKTKAKRKRKYDLRKTFLEKNVLGVELQIVTA